MELWDAYDVNFQKIEGVKLIRGEKIPQGTYHLVCEILVKHTDGTYLITQRDERKIFGGMWEASCGGSAIAGEAPIEAAKRELFEETGILSEDLTELGRVIQHRNCSIYADFLCETDCAKDSVRLQDGETQDYKWVTAKELAEMPSSELVTFRMQMFVNEIRK